MKKRIMVFALVVLCLSISPVYALTYDINLSATNTSVATGTETEVLVSLINIKDAPTGIASCSFHVELDSNIVLNPKARSLGDWNLTVGRYYLIDAVSGIKQNSDLISIPVKVKGAGSIKLTDILCGDGDKEASTGDKTLTFTIKSSASSTNPNPSDEKTETIDGQITVPSADEGSSNCDIEGVILSEGTVEFDSNTLDYYIDVNDVDNFNIIVSLSDKEATYVMDKKKLDNESIMAITVTSTNGTVKTYNFHLVSKETEKDSFLPFEINTTTLIFMGIILLLLIINIIRIINSKKKVIKK